MRIRHSFYLHFNLLFLLLNSCDENDAKHNMFSSVDSLLLCKEPVLV